MKVDSKEIEHTWTSRNLDMRSMLAFIAGMAVQASGVACTVALDAATLHVRLDRPPPGTCMAGLDALHDFIHDRLVPDHVSVVISWPEVSYE